jgi:hypothetical protein
VLCILALPCSAQDIEPRRWSHLPLGGNFAGVAYAYTEGDIFLLRTREDTGSDNDTFTLGCSLQW